MCFIAVPYVGNYSKSGAVFTTLHFLNNLQMVQISQSICHLKSLFSLVWGNTLDYWVHL